MVQALLEKHLISPTKQEVADKLLSTKANHIILTVQTEETAVKLQTCIRLPKLTLLKMISIKQILIELTSA